MPVYLVVRKSDGVVENAIKWDGSSPYDPGEEYELEAVSGEPGCPWIGWIRDESGQLHAPPPPPEPVYVRCAVFRKDTGKVVSFKQLLEDTPIMLAEPASFEYAIVACPDESVIEGWSYTDGEFVAP